MKAAVFYGKQILRIENAAKPSVTEDDVLIRVHACGICGTDMHIFDGDEGAAPTPSGTILGHEFAGEVVEVGANVTEVRPGDRVCVDPNKLCGECSYCKGGIGHFCEHITGIGTTVNGGFAEYCVVPKSQVYPFSARITYAQAAMTEPVSCCLHGIDLCEIQAGDTVAVFGGGMIGLLMLQLARLRGAATLILIEPIEEKRELAKKLGADILIDPFTQDIAQVLLQNGIERVSTVIECVGKTATIKQAIQIAGKKSVVMMFGLTEPRAELAIRPFEIFKKEIVLKASFINPYTQKRALALIDSGKIDVSSMVYRQASLDELPEILADRSKRTKGKYIIVPTV